MTYSPQSFRKQLRKRELFIFYLRLESRPETMSSSSSLNVSFWAPCFSCDSRWCAVNKPYLYYNLHLAYHTVSVLYHNELHLRMRRYRCDKLSSWREAAGRSDRRLNACVGWEKQEWLTEDCEWTRNGRMLEQTSTPVEYRQVRSVTEEQTFLAMPGRACGRLSGGAIVGLMCGACRSHENFTGQALVCPP